jgi:hypothetical protein
VFDCDSKGPPSERPKGFLDDVRIRVRYAKNTAVVPTLSVEDASKEAARPLRLGSGRPSDEVLHALEVTPIGRAYGADLLASGGRGLE